MNARIVQGRKFRTVRRTVEYVAVASRPAGPENGAWLPAGGGTEEVFTSRSGLRLLYCWQPSTGKHAYLNVETDIVLTDDEARAALMTW